jgi:hypothetical protein
MTTPTLDAYEWTRAGAADPRNAPASAGMHQSQCPARPSKVSRANCRGFGSRLFSLDPAIGRPARSSSGRGLPPPSSRAPFWPRLSIAFFALSRAFLAGIPTCRSAISLNLPKVTVSPTETVTWKAKEVSLIHREKSPELEERSSMSAAEDVLEMKSLARELADRLAGQGAAANKLRVNAVATEIGVSWNRALEFLSGKARRVDAWEKENAKRRIAELKDAERRQHENQYLDWLVSAPADERGPLLDRLEQALRVARGEAGPVALQEASVDHDQSREWPGI